MTTEVGRCGDLAPSLGQTMRLFCRLPHGHAGWHQGDDGSGWSEDAKPVQSRTVSLGWLLDGVPGRSEIEHRLAARFLVSTDEAARAIVLMPRRTR